MAADVPRPLQSQSAVFQDDGVLHPRIDVVYFEKHVVPLLRATERLMGRLDFAG